MSKLYNSDKKHAKVEKFIKKINKIHEETKVVLKKYADKNRKEVAEYKVEDRILLSKKSLM